MYILAAAEVFDGMMKKGAATLLLEVDEVGPMDTDTVYERSHFTFRDKDQKVMMQGK